ELASSYTEDMPLSNGVEAVLDILRTSRRNLRKRVVTQLSEEVPQLSRLLQTSLFSFEDIAILNDTDIQKIVQRIDPDDMVIALNKVDQDIRERIIKNMSKGVAKSLEDKLSKLSSVHYSKVEEARQRIDDKIHELIDEGIINQNIDL
ncbi:MAG: hypothetical protein OQK82_04000, partial [Candidatus Pacearchaeota archaeon]|nr:hypothetical protein [Candidatus Pacearchaeota archaeon]